MYTLDEYLKLPNCPQCGISNPNLRTEHTFSTNYDNGSEPKNWKVYVCNACGGAVLTMAYSPSTEIEEIYPEAEAPANDLPEEVWHFMDEAIRSISTPSASIIMSNSAVDAMLKEKGYEKESIYKRIEEAVKNHLLTNEMGRWAHQVRLDANNERHADKNVGRPTIADAKQTLQFAKTLGEFLFVLPAKVTRGITFTDPNTPKKIKNSKPPQTLDLPAAYRNGIYRQFIRLHNSKDKPTVSARLFNYTRTTPLQNDYQPGELIVTNLPGNPKAWQAEFVVENCNNLPEILFVEIIVDGQVTHAGALNVNKQTKA